MSDKTFCWAGDGHARRAALRDAVLLRARLLGWPPRAAVAFTERLCRRPWKRCSGAQLAAALDQLRAATRDRQPGVHRTPSAARCRRGGRHAHRR